MMRRLAFPLLFFGLTLAACGGSPVAPASAVVASSANGKSDLGQLYQAAKKEGELVWGANLPDTYAPVIALFQQRYPGIKVTPALVESTTVSQRLLTESAAKRLTIDLGLTSISAVSPLLDRDLIPTHDLKGYGIDAADIGLDGKMVWAQSLVLGVVYNSRLVTDAEAPHTWQDLLNPKWKGKILINKVPAGLDALPAVFGNDEAKMHDYVKQLGQVSIPISTVGEGTTKLSVGEGVLETGTLQSMLDQAAQGAPFAVAPVSPIPNSPQGLFTIKGIQHPNAAELFMVWMSTPEAKDAMSKAGALAPPRPCGPSSLDKFLCGKNIQIYAIDTVGKAQRAAQLREEFSKDWATRSNQAAGSYAILASWQSKSSHS